MGSLQVIVIINNKGRVIMKTKKKPHDSNRGVLNEIESLKRAVELSSKLLGCTIDLKITRVVGEIKQADGQANLGLTFPGLAKAMKPGESWDLKEMVGKKKRG